MTAREKTLFGRRNGVAQSTNEGEKTLSQEQENTASLACSLTIFAQAGTNIPKIYIAKIYQIKAKRYLPGRRRPQKRLARPCGTHRSQAAPFQELVLECFDVFLVFRVKVVTVCEADLK